ncbi:MAG: OmpA family protein [Proteiniphilum sp.]|nr:OmpA family protein [Proteiniphilum sp.]MDD4416280.1 OmpA family protein [Proteiniphilum sp.]
MKKFFIYMFALALFPAIASAQTREIKEEGKTVFKPHAYLQLQGGAAHTLGEVSFTDLISPAAAINLGYKFTPVFGARIGASGWQAKGAWVAPKQVYDFNYLQGNIDITLDIFSLFGGFNPTRIVNPYLFAGGGFAYGFNNDGANNLNTGGYQLEYLWKDNKTFIAGRGGLGIDFRLNDVVSLGLEGNVNLLPDKFNSKKADHPDWQFNALAGIKINLGKAYTRTEPVYYEPEPTPEPTPEPAPEPKPEPKPEPTPIVVKEFPVLPTVHFVRGSARIDKNKYASELTTIVSTLKEFENDAVEITGYCDHAGSDQLNEQLSLQRAEALKTYLTEQGIDASRMTTKGMGKDPGLSGKEAYTVVARRVEVTK